ncbi:MAG: long-chain fatty acid--CoA ligase [Gammaproteobacteria bacterium SG8_11]|nr:MAG: long-chain fatty acid--CoA ligase [Gammaproteobacteria bacterium SG8_11]
MNAESTSTTSQIEKIWLKMYPKGIPAEVDVNAYSSIVDVLEHSTQQFRQRPSFVNLGTQLTYGDLGDKTLEFATYLQQELGLRKGDKLAIMMPNLLQYPIALFGALRAGLTVTNVNPLYTPRELKHQLVDSGATAIVILENFCDKLSQVLADTQVKTVFTTRIGDMLSFPKSMIVNFVVKHVKKMVPSYRLSSTINFNHALQIGRQRKFQPVEINNQDIAFIQYTAGTTGVAKGVLLTHGNIVANLQQTSAWIGPFIEEGKEVIITPLPLYHIFSLTANCLLFMKIGAMICLITNPRDFKGFVNELKKVPFSAITGVNTLFNALLNTPGFSALDFSKLKITIGGGMAVQRSVAERWKSVTGQTLIEAYGLTETSPGVCINPIDLPEYNGNIGLPLPSTECSIQDDDGKILPIGEVGELCVRGPQVMQGYLNRPEQTDAVLKPDGWFHTGDMATIDEKGFVKILERKDDMIVVSGFNVYPNEIENVAAELPSVLESAAIGVPDEKSGQVVKIFVVKKDPALTEDELIQHCKTELAAYKVPKLVEFRDSLPKSNVGKILRRELR